MSKQVGNRAIVLGGSVAGMCCAQVLSSYFREVLVVERDAIDFNNDQPKYRPGVPQARHHHVMLARGRASLATLFEGFDETLAQAGAPLIDYGRDCALFTPIGGVPRFQSDIGIRPCRRQLIDWAIRQHLARNSNVKWLTECRIEELVTNDEKTKVTGVRLNGKREKYHYDADLVIDATGKNSKAPQWLNDWNYQVPEEESINPYMGYASQLFEPGPNFSSNWRAVEMAAQPPHNPRAAGLWEVEDGQWLLTLIGIAKEYPPTDADGFMAFAEKLPNPLVAQFLREAKPVSSIYGHRGSKTRRRQYHKMKRFPKGLLITGDAVASFNPIYGQGMTMAALGAMKLQSLLEKRVSKRQPLRGLAKPYHKAIFQEGLSAWVLATSEDFRWETTTGGTPDLITKLSYHYLDWLMPISAYNTQVCKAFLGIANQVTPSYSLLDPRIIFERLIHPLRAKSNPKLLEAQLYKN